MVSFESDYIAGAHPEVLKALMDTNLEQLPGYGTDKYSESAKEKIRAACECPDADVEFLVGGTQTNAVVISTLLKDYEGVIAADTGHVSTHEAGAIEHSGHKVLALPHVNGKLEAILTNTSLFGTDLIAAGLGEKIETMLKQMLAGPGAIRQTLKAYL